MTALMAVLVSELDNSFLRIELKKYSETVKGNHCPSVVTVKAVLKEIGIRQRQRKGFDYPTANESLEQLSRATAISKSAVSDALRFCEWIGLCETVRKGGGPNRVPTVRRLVTTGFPAKKLNEQKGELSNHNGEEPDQNGAFPQTPKDLPLDSNLFFDTYESKLNRDDAELTNALEESSKIFDQVLREWCENFQIEDEKLTEQLKALDVSIPNLDVSDDLALIDDLGLIDDLDLIDVLDDLNDLDVLLQGVADNFTRFDLD
jgi:hypothetical protein